MMNKRASELAFNKIVVLILIIIVLIVLVLIFTGTTSKILPSLDRIINDTIGLSKTIKPS